MEKDGRGKKWRIIRNIKRYGNSEIHRGRWPVVIYALGTLPQAEFIAEVLSSYEAGCDYFWVVDEEGGKVDFIQ